MGARQRTLLRLFAGTLVLAAACGSEPPAEEEPPEPETSPAAEAPRDTVPPQVAPITIAHVSNIHPERFPHEAHSGVECTTCHADVPGHATHALLACSRCHQTPSGATTRPTPAQCSACHHGPEQTRACVDCHGDRTPPERPITIMADFSVRPAPVSMTLPFAHERHSSLVCSTCHEQAGVRAPRECSRCHESHHTEERRCLTCHTTDPFSEHNRSAHMGCGGAGCHQDPVVTSLRQSRSVCLVCHRQQEEHEPGRDCAQCHIFNAPGMTQTIRSGGPAWSDR